jgi:tagatose 6-phosphate kinase
MILCLNANAAIDKTVVVPGFRLGEIHRPEAVLALPGGKGANVAKGLKRLGDQPLVSGWVGGFNGRFIEEGLRAEGIQTAFVYVESESRTCLSILDPDSGTLTEIYERGDLIPPDQIAELKNLFRAQAGSCAAVTLSGSLPPGVPSDFYADLIRIATEMGVRVFLDTSGEALRCSLEAGRPFLIQPNAREFAELVGRQVESREEQAETAREVAARYGTIAALSLGAEGALIAGPGESFLVRPPRLAIRSAVGSGDCLLAGLAYGVTHGFALREAARYGVAAGTANALTVGAGVFSLHDFQQVLAQVEIVDC